MSSAGKTENYQLNQWARTDGVCMDDFNSDNSKIDAAIKAVNTEVDTKAKLLSGSYVGTGTSGVNGKSSLTFPFAPKLVYIYKPDGNVGCVVKDTAKAYFLLSRKTYSCSGVNPNYVAGETQYLEQTISWSADGKSLYWYYDLSECTGYAERQYNASQTTYYYLAIG